jgi:hypothetical protein
VKPRILNFGITATHDTIVPLTNIEAALSISDFHAFGIDPNKLAGAPTQETFLRRTRELQDLILRKGGMIVCLLRPDNLRSAVAGVGPFNRYSLLERAGSQAYRLVNAYLESGTGSSVICINSAKGPTAAYFRVLRENLQFEAFLNSTEAQVAQYSGIVFAVNSVGYPIAVEFRIGEGVISFVPVPFGVPEERIGAAIVKMVAAHFNKHTDIDVPTWTQGITVPGATAYSAGIAELSTQRERLTTEISNLEGKRDGIASYLRLLFGYGKGVLEPQVRTALRLLGFTVREPEEYTGEWDIDLTDGQSSKTAIGEVEGSEGPIDVDKSRQLLDYIGAEAIEGRDHKGLLIGNGFRLTPPEASERQQQFSDHARRAAARFQFCLLPTTELFKAVCAVLESPQDEALKMQIRESLLGTVGTWSFAREQAPQNQDSQK